MPNNPRRHSHPKPAQSEPAFDTPQPDTAPAAAAADVPNGNGSAPDAQAAPPSSPASPASAVPQQQQPQQPPPKRLNITDLKDMSIQKLTGIAKDLSVAG